MNEVNETEIRAELATMPGANIDVVDQRTYELAGDSLRDIATVKKNIKAKFADPKKKAAEAHKAICNLENELLAKVSDRENEIRHKMTSYYVAEQRRIRAEAERQRIEAEKMLQLATEAEAQGDSETAVEAVTIAALEESKVTYAPETDGVSMHTVWRANVIDPMKVPREYLIVNDSALQALAKATKGTINIPGVEFVEGLCVFARSK